MAPPDDIRLSFENAVEIYDEVRPSYPAELFDELFGLLPPEPHVVEVGPGTGKATRDLLARGASVRAVEIGPGMAARLRSNLPTQRLEVSVGDFEKIEIEPGADAIFSATAYHWISPAAQTDRPAAILRPGGLVAIVDLVQVDSPDDLGFFASASRFTTKWTGTHRTTSRLGTRSTPRSAPCSTRIAVTARSPSADGTGIRPTPLRTTSS